MKQKDLLDLKASAHEDLYVRANTGIVIGYSVKHIVDAIRREHSAAPEK